MKVYVIMAESFNEDNSLRGYHIVGVTEDKKTAEAVAQEYVDSLEKIGYTHDGFFFLPKIRVYIQLLETRI